VKFTYLNIFFKMIFITLTIGELGGNSPMVGTMKKGRDNSAKFNYLFELALLSPENRLSRRYLYDYRNAAIVWMRFSLDCFTILSGENKFSLV
jgi:hypothetical protein